MAGYLASLLIMLSIMSGMCSLLLAGAIYFILKPAVTGDASSSFPLPNKKAKSRHRVVANDDAAAYRAEVKEQEKHKLS